MNILIIYCFFSGHEHPCNINNGGCEQECKTDATAKVICDCRDGFMLAADNVTCKGRYNPSQASSLKGLIHPADSFLILPQLFSPLPLHGIWHLQLE